LLRREIKITLVKTNCLSHYFIIYFKTNVSNALILYHNPLSFANMLSLITKIQFNIYYLPTFILKTPYFPLSHIDILNIICNCSLNFTFFVAIIDRSQQLYLYDEHTCLKKLHTQIDMLPYRSVSSCCECNTHTTRTPKLE